MRRSLLAPLLSAVFLLTACQMVPVQGNVTGLNDDAIAVTPLDAPGAAQTVTQGMTAPEAASPATASTPHPQARPDGTDVTPDQPPAADAAPQPDSAAPKTAAHLFCEKSKGRWVMAGETGAFYCASTTRDGGKQCSVKTQCQGQCLARSGTCSPIIPLYGCNDVLEKDGRMVTLCID